MTDYITLVVQRFFFCFVFREILSKVIFIRNDEWVHYFCPLIYKPFKRQSQQMLSGLSSAET